jgi:hypothetical protein
MIRDRKRESKGKTLPVPCLFDKVSENKENPDLAYPVRGWG